MFDRVILFSFYALFFITPLFWTSFNFELFEYNKMMLVYFLTVIVTGTWILKMIKEKKLNLKTTPLDISILLFLTSQIVSSFFSIDPHTSIFGYYSRSNGGLLSTISYILLYYALVSNLDKKQVINLLKVGLLGGLVVALYAIPEHFGISPSCVILRGDFSDQCWIQDVKARVFATLGQPNWLAAYLEMLIFPAVYFFLTTKEKYPKMGFYLMSILFYMAFTFTYSRGASLGLIIGGLVFLPLIFYSLKQKASSVIKPLAIILVTFLLINIVFGSALTRFQLSTLFNHTDTTQPSKNAPAVLTQLENGGTESGTIRLIVWRGALEIFKHYPLFGSGVESFAYSYYQFRPQEHNLVSEWDFLYNKAHNEYLNYLATTGIFGFTSYLAIIILFLYWCIKYYIQNLKRPLESSNVLFTFSLLASFVSFLVQNIFGFSVVIIAVFFFLFPGIVFVNANATKQLILPKKLQRILNSIAGIFFKKPVYTKSLNFLIIIASLFLFSQIIIMWYADTLFAKGESASENGHPGIAYNYLMQAAVFNRKEPYYHSELGYTAAASSIALQDTEATLSSFLTTQAVEETQKALSISPKNVSFWRTAIRTYYLLASLQPEYTQKTLETIDKAISLAPTDPKLFYNKAIILGQTDKVDEAIDTLQKAIELKKNYREAYFALAILYFDQKRETEAVETMNKILILIPNDPEALSQLNTWGKSGIATASAINK